MFHDRSVRIGIDVGGTFTHAVAVDATSLAILGKVKVFTTHRAKEGVAAGIVEALNHLLKSANINPERVAFIAHSTTQATNALLEGDVAPVGIIGMGSGINAWLAKLITNPGQIRLAPGKFLKTYHRFIDTSCAPSKDDFKQVFTELREQGAQAFAISEAFSPDNSTNEKMALATAQAMGLPASIGSEISQLYGLKIRTRTTILNAAMLPKMLETANLTEKCVRESGIKAPLMIMRSDGGVMDITAMRRRPILTMLSGPAAGVAGAMMFLNISDGIFIEVGGTSTDISVIKNGRAQVRSAEIGGHKLFLRTLDVRTVGVAGGSMARVDKSKVIDSGPRSAHISGLKYIAFADGLTEPKVKLISPMSGDPADYVAIAAQSDQAPQYCLTNTCAANLLGLVPTNDCAFSNSNTIKTAFDALGKLLGKQGKQCAQEFLTAATAKCEPIIKALIKNRKLDDRTVTLYGGGGGAAAIVPYLSKHMNLRFALADSADVLSAIGVALALIHETIERQIINPTNDDILRLRQEAQAALELMGAAPSSVEVFVEVDPQTSTVRATATGATSMVETKKLKAQLSTMERISLISQSMRVPIDQVQLAAENDYFQVFTAQKVQKSFFGLIKTQAKLIRALDQAGTIRFQSGQADVVLAKAKDADKAIIELTNQVSSWGDAGRCIPNIIIFAGTKMVDLSGLISTEQVLSLCKIELDSVPLDSSIIVVATPN